MEWRQNVRVVAFAAASFCMLCFVYIFLENMSAILLLSFLDFFRSPCIRQQASTVWDLSNEGPNNWAFPRTDTQTPCAFRTMCCTIVTGYLLSFSPTRTYAIRWIRPQNRDRFRTTEGQGVVAILVINGPWQACWPQFAVNWAKVPALCWCTHLQSYFGFFSLNLCSALCGKCAHCTSLLLQHSGALL